jgi:hypothetical protein
VIAASLADDLLRYFAMQHSQGKVIVDVARAVGSACGN